MSEYFRKYIKRENYPINPGSIRFRTSFKNTVLEALRRRTWKETDGEMDWDIIWGDKEWAHEIMDHGHLESHQKVNHFRNHYELTRKDLMIKNLKRYKKTCEKEGRAEEAASIDFFPVTFNMPSEYSLFVEEFKKNPNNVWIMKPVGKAQGRGIFLFTKLTQVSQWKVDFRWKPENPQAESYVVQKYIPNPLLIGGKKFDLRIYVLVTAYQPLTVYLYRTGFARFSHQRYSNDDLGNNYVHLTNVAIQKNAENYDSSIGGKWDLKQLKQYLISKYGRERVAECFSQIQQIFIKSLLAVQRIMINDKHCFELYGYDIIIDTNLKPWILECNASPSLTANTPADFQNKVDMLDDVFSIIDLERVMTGNEECVGGFDMIYKGGPILTGQNSVYQSYLGCHNPREDNLKNLAKQAASRLANSHI